MERGYDHSETERWLPWSFRLAAGFTKLRTECGSDYAHIVEAPGAALNAFPVSDL